VVNIHYSHLYGTLTGNNQGAEKVYTIKKNGWAWELRDHDALEDWFDSYEQIMRTNCIKSNSERSVFTAGNYFVKFDDPQKTIQKVRSFIRPKVKQEFEAGLKLEAACIPVVKYIGWARRGPQGMVITEAFDNAVDFGVYWFTQIVEGRVSHCAAVNTLSSFLKTFFAAGFYHPDFHLGNILINPDTLQVALVDVYGVKKQRSLNKHEQYDSYKILFSLRDVLDDSAIIDMMLQTGIAHDEESAFLYWRYMLKTESEKVNTFWPKRKKQIVAEHEKYVTAIGRHLLLRHSHGRTPLVDESTLKQLPYREYSPAEAQSIWLRSFQLQFHAIPHIRPLALDKSGKRWRIIFEDKESDGTVVDGIEEFTMRCTIAGIRKECCIDAAICIDGKLQLDISALERDSLFENK